MEVVSVNCIKHKFSDNTEVSLCGMDFSAKKGESIAVIGSNGSGKSTLLLHIAGILESLEGEIKVFGEKVGSKGFEKVRKKIGMLFQDSEKQLLGPTVYDDIAFGPLNAGWSKKDVENAVEETLAHFNISHLAEKVPHYLSGGEKRKVALAGTIIMKPELLLLDEPFAHLDPTSKKEIMEHLNHYKKENNATIIVALHEVEIIPLFSDKVFVLAKGKGVTMSGDSLEIFNKKDLLADSDIEIPPLMELFHKIAEHGYKVKMPKNTEEAEKEFLKLLKK